MLFNWVLGLLLMFTLAWVFLPDLPHYRNGLVMIGLARCIAMVLIWNMLARGDGDAAAVLVALNSLFQIVFYSVLGWFYLTALPGWLGAESTAFAVSMWDIAKSVLIFLGIRSRPVRPPAAPGAAPGRGLVRHRADALRPGPTALLGLLYTIVADVCDAGRPHPGRAAGRGAHRRAPGDLLPRDVHAGLRGLRPARVRLPGNRALSFTAAGNNFELAIAVAVGSSASPRAKALAGVVGPLIEVPVLLALVYVALWLQARFLLRGVAGNDACGVRACAA